MTKAALPLSQLTKAELEFLRKAIAKRQVPTPLTQASLQSIGKGSAFARLGPLAAAGEDVALAMIDLALAAAEAGPAARTYAPAVLAWTIPDVTLLQGGVRATTPVVLEMLGAAQQRVLIAGYEFDHGAVIFQPLYKAMVERGVKVTIYVDVPRVPSPKSNLDAHLALQAHRFLKENWPFGAPLPDLYYWPAGCEYGSRASLHAKCMVVDSKYALIGSANFTRRGYKRNLEIGVRLEDAALASSLVQQFEGLVDKGQLVRMPAVVAHEPPPAAAENEEDAALVLTVHNTGADALAAELLVSDAARPLFARLIASGLPVPLVGEDVEGDGGEVIGSPELVWEASRAAVLLPEQEGSRKKLEAAGWTCFAGTPDEAAFEALCEAIRREG